MRGRPPLPPEERKPRASGPSGPSGKHRPIDGAELIEQQRVMRAALPASLAEQLELGQAIPVGLAPLIAAALGMTQRSAADLVGKMWRGKRRYRQTVRIF